MKPERATKLLSVTSWAIPLAFVALMMLSLGHFWQSSAAVGLLLIGLTLCALVLALVCGSVARGRSRSLHGGKYLWQAILGFYLSLTILSLYLIVLVLLLATSLRQ